MLDWLDQVEAMYRRTDFGGTVGTGISVAAAQVCCGVVPPVEVGDGPCWPLTERERDGQRDRERETERQRDTDRGTIRERQKEGQRETEREKRETASLPFRRQ
jgi:hypothetical protein